MRKIFCGLYVFFFSLFCAASAKQYELGAGVLLEGTTTADSISLSATMPVGHWLGLGFGKDSMTDVNMVILTYVDGVATAADSYSTGHSSPGKIEDTWTIKKEDLSDDATSVTLTIERALEVSAELADDHYNFPQGVSFPFIFAYKEGDFGYHGRGNRFESTLFLEIGGGDVYLGEVASSGTPMFWKLHGAFLYAVWGWLSLIAILSNRHFRHYPGSHIVHSLAGLTILIVTIVFSAIALKKSKPHYAHKTIGTIILALVCLQAVGGLTLKAMMNTLRWRTRAILLSKLMHRLLGWSLLILSNANMVLGLNRAEHPLRKAIYGQFALEAAILVVAEIIYWMRAKRKDIDLHVDAGRLQSMSPDEFLMQVRGGKQWAMYNQYVVDVTSLLSSHPGGRFVIEKNIGREIGKYLYGAYTVESSSMSPHAHTRYAFDAMKRLIIGKIVTPQVYMHGDLRSTGIQETDDPKSNLVVRQLWKVVERSPISGQVYRIVFQNNSSIVPKWYKGVQFVGCHFVVHSQRNFVSRYYTICNCLALRFHNLYLDRIRTFEAQEKPKEGPKRASSFADDSRLELVIKQYRETQTGISNQVHDDNASGSFEIKGPYGTGLGLGPSSSGTHLVFVGGTGILVFLDLVAYMLRRMLAGAAAGPGNEVFEGEEFPDLDDGFELVMYAAFPRRSEGIGLELCEGAARVSNKLTRGRGGFRFVPIFSREGGERLSAESIERILSEHSRNGRVKKLWVCGPPPMNETFERALEFLAPKYEISPQDCEVL